MSLPVVITEVFSQREQVRRLVQYIKELDGTEVKVIQISPEDDKAFRVEYPHNERGCRAAFSLHTAAVAMKGQPFIWLEHDSIPLQVDWVKKISAEYKRRGKPFMLSSDSNPPHDLIGGIGVYGPDTHWIIPQNFRRDGWDLWMVRNIPELIARTPLVQHSYGIYDEKGHASSHRFPRDNYMLRADALIFHADKNHDLLKRKAATRNVFYHSGDLGDIIYHLEVVRRMDGGGLFLGPELDLSVRHPGTREPMTASRAANIQPLLLVQPYVTEAKFVTERPDPEWINLNKFRETLVNRESLQRACLRHFKLQPQDETQPWLSVPEPRISGGYIAIARSPRYHREEGFPWHEIMAAHRDYCLFVGLLSEHQDFVRRFGEVTYRPTRNLLDLAIVINNAQCFIGNQSSPYAIAEGLKKPAVQETWEQEYNCIFERPNVLNHTSDFVRIAKFIEAFI